METTEKIVEAYVRYVKHWATIPNIRCGGQLEIDLLAIDPRNPESGRYHIESGVSVSGAFSELTAVEYSPTKLKQRLLQPQQRRTVGYFDQRKFRRREVREALERYGFTDGNYRRVIVTWSAKQEALELAQSLDIEVWFFPEIIEQIAQTFEGTRSYFMDDTLRTVHLFSLARACNRERSRRRERELGGLAPSVQPNSDFQREHRHEDKH